MRFSHGLLGDNAFGRLASAVATMLRGKRNALWSPYVDVGDHVIVINADRVNS